MSEGSNERWDKWLASRPPGVQLLAREFPIPTQFQTESGPLWVIGYTETDEVIVSELDPSLDYGAAVKARLYIHAHCLRDAIARACHVQSH